MEFLKFLGIQPSYILVDHFLIIHSNSILEFGMQVELHKNTNTRCGLPCPALVGNDELSELSGNSRICVSKIDYGVYIQ